MEPQKQKRLRGKSPETQYSEAVEELNRLVHTPDVDEVKIKAQRTLVIALAKRVAAKQKNKKIDKLDQLRMVVKTLEDKVAGLTLEVETLKREQRPIEPVAPVAPVDAVTMDSIETTLERMRRAEKLGEGLSSDAAMAKLRQVEPVEPVASSLPAISVIPQRIRLTPPRPGEEMGNDNYQQVLAVEATFPAKTPEEVAALGLMEKRYGDSPEAVAAREQRVQAAIADARKAKEPAPSPTCDSIKEIEAQIEYEADLERRKKELDELLAKLRAQSAAGPHM